MVEKLSGRFLTYIVYPIYRGHVRTWSCVFARSRMSIHNFMAGKGYLGVQRFNTTRCFVI